MQQWGWGRVWGARAGVGSGYHVLDTHTHTRACACAAMRPPMHPSTRTHRCTHARTNVRSHACTNAHAQTSTSMHAYTVDAADVYGRIRLSRTEPRASDEPVRRITRQGPERETHLQPGIESRPGADVEAASSVDVSLLRVQRSGPYRPYDATLPHPPAAAPMTIARVHQSAGKRPHTERGHICPDPRLRCQWPVA
jgi:hypothetical protein